MSIKLCLLKNGDTCIADVKEMLDPGEDVSAGYLLCDPFKLNTVESSSTTTVDANANYAEQNQERRLSFSRLFSLSNDRNFSVTHDFVDVIYNAHQNLVDTYLDIVASWVQENVKEINLEHTLAVDSEEMTEEQVKALNSSIENSRTNAQPEYVYGAEEE
tara:strand:+ start:1618 stop:2097 length:480 start_codon:yes stop_codon:yes gene_type:complete